MTVNRSPTPVVIVGYGQLTSTHVSYLGRTTGSVTGASLSPVYGFGTLCQRNSVSQTLNLFHFGGPFAKTHLFKCDPWRIVTSVLIAPYKYCSTTSTIFAGLCRRICPVRMRAAWLSRCSHYTHHTVMRRVLSSVDPSSFTGSIIPRVTAYFLKASFYILLHLALHSPSLFPSFR